MPLQDIQDHIKTVMRAGWGRLSVYFPEGELLPAEAAEMSDQRGLGQYLRSIQFRLDQDQHLLAWSFLEVVPPKIISPYEGEGCL